MILVQAGAGGVGVAAIQLGHRAGATVLATVSGAARADALRSRGLDHAIDHRAVDVGEAVSRLTYGRGVDLVVDPVGATLQASLALLRPEGRLVFVGNAGGSSLQLDVWPALQGNQSLLGVFMGSQFERPEVYQTVSKMLQQASEGELDVIVDRSFPLSAAAEAHAYAERHGRLGRIVLIP